MTWRVFHDTLVNIRMTVYQTFCFGFVLFHACTISSEKTLDIVYALCQEQKDVLLWTLLHYDLLIFARLIIQTIVIITVDNGQF